MIYAYIRVSTDRQSTENQRFEILTFASERRRMRQISELVVVESPLVGYASPL